MHYALHTCTESLWHDPINSTVSVQLQLKLFVLCTAVGSPNLLNKNRTKRRKSASFLADRGKTLLVNNQRICFGLKLFPSLLKGYSAS